MHASLYNNRWESWSFLLKGVQILRIALYGWLMILVDIRQDYFAGQSTCQLDLEDPEEEEHKEL